MNINLKLLTMKIIKKFEYKGFPIELKMDEHEGITFSCCSMGKFQSKHNPNHINGGWDKPEDAINTIKEEINEFLLNQPKNYKELASAIEEGALVWTGYEECHIDKKLLEIIIKNFLLTQN